METNKLEKIEIRKRIESKIKEELDFDINIYHISSIGFNMDLKLNGSILANIFFEDDNIEILIGNVSSNLTLGSTELDNYINKFNNIGVIVNNLNIIENIVKETFNSQEFKKLI